MIIGSVLASSHICVLSSQNFKSHEHKYQPHTLLSNKTLRQANVLHPCRILEQWCDITIFESSYPTSNPRNIEEKVGAGFGEGYELVDIGLDCFDASLHSWYRIGLTTKTNPTTHYGPKLPERKIGRSSPMHSLQVASEDKDFIGL